eukprot:gene3603-3946_t
MILWIFYVSLFCLLFGSIMLSDTGYLPKVADWEALNEAVLQLRESCLDVQDKSQTLSQTQELGERSWLICFGRSIQRVSYHPVSHQIRRVDRLGEYRPDLSLPDREVYLSPLPEPTCAIPPPEEGQREGEERHFRTEVVVQCCPTESSKTAVAAQRLTHLLSSSSPSSPSLWLLRVSEPQPCLREIVVCSSSVCLDRSIGVSAMNVSQLNQERRGRKETGRKIEIISELEQESLKNRTLRMFYHAYDSYMTHAFPQGELRPLSCEGGNFDLVKLPAVTLIDALDALVVIGNHSEFRRAVDRLIVEVYPVSKGFDLDVNVSVFETTIRVLGGLLSAHLLALDPLLSIYGEDHQNAGGHSYEGELLQLAVDLADRLLPAFQTKTGIPYGTVNLRHGVPRGETKVASTAGAGSLLLEFHTLSLLTGEAKYSLAASRALQALFDRRSVHHLVGKHIATDTGHWHETVSGVGSNSDSFYEYLLKGSVLPGLQAQFSPSNPSLASNSDLSVPATEKSTTPLLEMFVQAYEAVKTFVILEDQWFHDVDMFSGKVQRKRMESLDAFWPGLEVQLGRMVAASRQVNTFYAIARDLSGFLPEEVDYLSWLDGQNNGNLQYPLRPELLEATYFLYRGSRDRSWLSAAQQAVEKMETSLRTDCGFASVEDLHAGLLTDSMPSYFLSETLKYLFLLFDEGGGALAMHSRPFLFTTEAHPLDVVSLQRLHSQSALGKRQMTPLGEEQRERQGAEVSRKFAKKQKKRNSEKSPVLLLLCPRAHYLHSLPPSYDSTSHTKAASSSSPIISSNVKTRAMRWIRSFYLRYDRSSDKLAIADGLSAKCPREATSATSSSSSSNSPTPASPSATTKRHRHRMAPIKKVDVNLGVLGDFHVQVFADGFSIESLLDRRLIDIYNGDKQAVLVREADLSSSQESLVMGTLHNHLTTCTVSIASSSWSRACSLGTFGPQDSLSVSGSLKVFPAQPRALCSPLLSSSQQDTASENIGGSGKGSSKAEVGLQTSPSSVVASGGNELWRRLIKRFLSPTTVSSSAQVSSKPVPAEEVAGKMLMVRRGDCLFEEKALVAQQAGARALLIRNHDDGLFIMAGKGSLNSDKELWRQTINIPTVLIEAQDGLHLDNVAAALKDEEDVTIDITVQTKHDVLQTVLMGDESFPKVWMGRRIIYILSSSSWGAYFKAQPAQAKDAQATQGETSEEWQMYIIHKRDISTHRLLPPTVIYSPKKHKMTSTVHLLRPAGEVYNTLLRRKCPRDFIVSGGGKSIQLL